MLLSPELGVVFMQSKVSLFARARGLVGSLAAAGALLSAGVASAAPVLGAQLFWAGGEVQITVQPASAGYTSELTLYSADPDIFLALNSQVGTVVTLSAAVIDANHDIGDELRFGIFVRNTGDIFYMGAASRNADNLVHAGVDNLGGGVLRVGFEDLLGGGDRDYDDNVFDFRGGVRSTVPEPGTLALAGLALVGIGAARRARRQA